MTKPLSYWEKRKAREAFEMYEDVEKVAREMTNLYADVSNQIEQDARRIFRRFKTKHSLSEREAEKLLKAVYDPTKIAEITQKLKQNPKNTELAAQLESQAYASRINRLARLQGDVDDLTTRILGSVAPTFDATLATVAAGAYYREIFGLQQRANAGFFFNPMTEDRIASILARNWSGKSYSQRLWDNTEALSQSVKRELMKGLLVGKSPFRMSQTIQEEFQKGATASRRLMRTEATYVANQVTEEAYHEAGVEKYIYVAILDLRTSEVCRELDKKRFLVSNAEPGENYPPMHPWCRSTTIAWMPDELLKTLQQSAIDPATGERITVSGNMDYEAWYNTYVRGKEEEIKEREAQPKVSFGSTADQFEKYKAIYGNVIPETTVEFEQLKRNNPTMWDSLKVNKQVVINNLSDADLYYLEGKLGNGEVRRWYKARNNKIPELIDKTQPLEIQARQACNIRNANKAQARRLMKNETDRVKLDISEPSKTFEQLLEHKHRKYGLEGDAAYLDIIRSSATTNIKYDRKAGINHA